MDITEMTPTHQLLWILLAFLLTWMILFAWLAIRQTPEAKSEKEKIAYLSLPAKVALTTQHIAAAKQTSALAIKHETNKEIYLEQSVH